MGFPFRSLREWIGFLEERGALLRTPKEIELRGDVSAFCQWCGRFDGPALLHEQILGYGGWRVFTDGLTTRQRQAWAFGLDPEGMVKDLAQKLQRQSPTKPRLVPTGPCKELKFFADEIDLAKLPLDYSGEFSIPPFITAGMSNVRDPETGWQNSGIRRFQLKDRAKLCTLILPQQDEGVIFAKYKKAREPMPVAMVIGADPLYYLSCLMIAPAQFDEIDYWGVFAGEPLEVVRAETSDLLVPATAEIIIEGFVDPFHRELEGVFSEFTGYYSGYNMCPTIEVKAVTMRQDPIYQHMYQGVPASEGTNLNALLAEVELYRQLKLLIPEMTDVAVLSTCFFTVAVSLDKKAKAEKPGLVKKLGMALRSVNAGKSVKNLFVVDDDVDIHSYRDVLWCFSVRFQAAKDITVIGGVQGLFLDPSEPWLGYGPGHTSFAIFDCTEKPAPYDEGYLRGVAYPPLRSMGKVRELLSDYNHK